jgi:hypothetical protein
VFLPSLPPAPFPARRAYRPEGRAYASERSKGEISIPLVEDTARGEAGKGDLASHYQALISLITCSNFPPSKRDYTFWSFICLSEQSEDPAIGVPQNGRKAKINHVYHVNPVKCLLFTPETVEPFQFSPAEPVD